MLKIAALFLLILGMLLTLNGCTVHPQGEREERAAAMEAGKPFEIPATQRSLPDLPDNPTPEDLVRYALLSSPEIERQFWDWRAAIEQIPQDGAQATNLAFGGSTSISRGSGSLDRTTATLGNDPMADIVWPSKLSTAARRALENARAAGLRFMKAKIELRQKVLDACYDYALSSELIRLQEASASLLKLTRDIVESRNTSGAATQQEVLKVRNELDLSLNEIANMKFQRESQRATINALLWRPPAAPLSLGIMPEGSSMDLTDEQIVARAAEQNPELRALAMEIAAHQDGLKLATLQYIPDFSLGAGADLAGIAQSVSGMVTVPILRHEAIRASIAQAEARLRSADAMFRGAANDLRSRLLIDILTVREADRQLELFNRTILPRAREAVTLSRSGYESGQSSAVDLLESENSLLAFGRLTANLTTLRNKRLVDIETAMLKPSSLLRSVN